MRSKNQNSMIVTTSSELKGYTITDYRDVQFSTAVIGTGFISETLASFSDTFGIRSGSFERKINKARRQSSETCATKPPELAATVLSDSALTPMKSPPDRKTCS